MTVERLKSAVGRQIQKIARVQYVVRGELWPDESGPIEFEFADKSILLVETGPDEYSLRVQYERWNDPFEDPLDGVNRAFVAKSGKWTRFDVSGDPLYENLIGAVITDVALVQDPNGVVTGALVSAGEHVIRVDVGANDIIVRVA